jgi:hypothetical protein
MPSVGASQINDGRNSFGVGAFTSVSKRGVEFMVVLCLFATLFCFLVLSTA